MVREVLRIQGHNALYFVSKRILQSALRGRRERTLGPIQSLVVCRWRLGS